MGVVIGVLKEEFDRLSILKQKYQEIISSYPKGSISKKKRWNKYYIYLSFRDNNKVIHKYIGIDNDPESIEIINKINERKNYESKLKEIRKDLKEVEKLLNAGKREKSVKENSKILFELLQ